MTSEIAVATKRHTGLEAMRQQPVTAVDGRVLLVPLAEPLGLKAGLPSIRVVGFIRGIMRVNAVPMHGRANGQKLEQARDVFGKNGGRRVAVKEFIHIEESAATI
ncbi:MAG: hypothetical protein RL015_3151 [Verrucomicrobiota bacterium]